MTFNLNRRTFTLAAAATLFQSTRVGAASHGNTVVQMLSRDPQDSRNRNIFSPRLLVIEAGQSVLFEATDRGHNSASIAGMVPPNGPAWDGGISEDIEVTFDTPGFYGYVCTPHATLGMVGMVVVTGGGMTDNLDAARAVTHRGKSRRVFEDIWAEIAAQGLA